MTFVSDSTVYDFNPGTGAGFFVVSGYLQFRGGTTYRIDSGLVTWIRDRNGNEIQFSYNISNEVTQIEDQNGRYINVAYLTGPCLGAATTCDQITYHGWNGATRTVEIGYNSLANVLRSGQTQTYSQLFPEAQLSQPQPTFDPSVVSYIRYFDGSEFTLQYDGYAEVAKVTLPTGGAYQYDYEGLPPNTSGSGFAGNPTDTNPVMIDRELMARREYSDGTTLSGSFAYVTSYKTNSTPPFAGVTTPVPTVVTTVTSTDDLYTANVSVPVTYSYGGNPTNALDITGTTYDGWYEGLEFETQSGQSTAQTALKTGNQWWQQGLAAPAWCAGSCFLGGPVSNPQVYEAQTTLNDTNQVSEVDYAYDTHNNVTSKSEYDYGSGARGALKRVTNTAYVTSSSYTSASVNLVSLPLSVVVTDGTTTYAQTEYCYDGQATLASWCSGQTFALTAEPNIVNASFGASYTTRGNPTLVSRWLKGTGSGTWLSTTAAYDVAGNTVSVTDPLNNPTTASYANYPNNAYASPTSITNALSQVMYWTYDYNTGKPYTSADPNQTQDGLVTAYEFSEPLDRLTQVRRGSTTGGTSGQCSGTLESDTNYRYPDPNTVHTYQDQSTCNDQALVSTVDYDGFGRVSASSVGDPGGTIELDHAYDGLDRLYSVSNPYQTGTGAETPHYTTYLPYDSLGRILTQTASDGKAATQTAYSGNTTTVTDPAGVGRTLTSDALGRLTNVLESPSYLKYTTAYLYDPIDDLTAVCQGAAFSGGSCPSGSQSRLFGYDSLKRLTSAANPETASVATSYTYDADGNLATKSDPNGNKVTNSYDALNRITSKIYTGAATPAVTYCYDGTAQGACVNAPSGSSSNLIGRLTLVDSSASSTAYGNYDPRGNILQSTQATGGHSYPFSYTYNLANSVTGETLPSGRTVAWGHDSADRISSATGTPPGGTAKTYASSVLYASQGGIGQINLGNGPLGQGLVEWRTYDALRQQLTGINLGTSNTDSSKLALGLAYCPGAPPPSSCATNNGNLQSQTIGPLGATQTYTYDTLNRLWVSTEKTGTTTNWSETFNYDNFGNRWVPSSSGISLSPLTVTVNYYNSATNRSTYQYLGYDNNGNQNFVSPYTIAYDAENRQTGITSTMNGSAVYGYDGDGRRVTKAITGGATTTYVYDAEGELAAEYSTQPPAMPCATCYLTVDHLGSTRLLTDQNGNPVSRHDFLPFGEELTTSNRTPPMNYGVTDDINQKFTGKERDAETGLDYFGARYFSSAQGRFTSPDPIHIMPQKLLDPQQWNMYAYVRNNPLRLVDPTGMYVTNCAEDDKACNKRIDTFEKARQRDLKSKNEAVRDAAAQYGDRGKDNGVTVQVLTPQQMIANPDIGQVVNGATQPVQGQDEDRVNIFINSELGGKDLQRTIAHEGTHLGMDLDFINGFNPDTGRYDPNLNFTHGQTEFISFMTGAAVKKYNYSNVPCGGAAGCQFGPQDANKINQFLHNHPQYGPIYNLPVFSPGVWKQ